MTNQSLTTSLSSQDLLHSLPAAGQLRDANEVRAALRKLGSVLPASPFPRLSHFNTAYLIITERVLKAIQDNEFDDPDFLHRFDARFAEYYFDALRRFLQRQPTPKAWCSAFKSSQVDAPQAGPLASMALGVNAHINNDIPQVLHDLRARQRHYADYQRVNRLIDDCLNDVVRRLHPQTRLQKTLSPQRRVLRPAYRVGMRVAVRLWRAKAWRNYVLLRQTRLTKASLERYASSFTPGLIRLPG